MIRYATLFIVTIMTFVVFNIMIYQKQKLLRSGETIYFAIEPADPRSLMQGDYMTFRYSLEKEIEQENVKPTAAKQGYLVIAYDAQSVGHFKRFYAGEALAADERLLKFNYRPNQFPQWDIKPHTFFFQEKLQPDFQKATFAIFHYNGDKNYLLVGLADKDKRRIDPKTHTGS